MALQGAPLEIISILTVTLADTRTRSTTNQRTCREATTNTRHLLTSRDLVSPGGPALQSHHPGILAHRVASHPTSSRVTRFRPRTSLFRFPSSSLQHNATASRQLRFTAIRRLCELVHGACRHFGHQPDFTRARADVYSQEVTPVSNDHTKARTAAITASTPKAKTKTTLAYNGALKISAQGQDTGHRNRRQVSDAGSRVAPDHSTSTPQRDQSQDPEAGPAKGCLSRFTSAQCRQARALACAFCPDSACAV